MAGLLKLGKFIRLVPHPVMFGFVNGLAIVIFMAQMDSFKNVEKDPYGNDLTETVSTVKKYNINDNHIVNANTNLLEFELLNNQIIHVESSEVIYEIFDGRVYDVNKKKIAYNINDNGIYEIEQKGVVKNWLSQNQLLLMIGLTLLTMLIIWGLPKITKFIPSSLAAIIVVSLIVIGFNIDTKTVGDIASINGGFPPFNIPHIPFTMETFLLIFPYALIVAGGYGSRMQSKTPKQFLLLAQKPVLMHTIEAFVKYSKKTHIILVLPDSEIEQWKKLPAFFREKINEVLGDLASRLGYLAGP
mgnify:CR=1 FL=1